MNNSYEDLVDEIEHQFGDARGCSLPSMEILQLAQNQEASASVRRDTRSCPAKCNFRGTANVIAFVISILLITVDYTVISSLLYCSTPETECTHLNI